MKAVIFDCDGVLVDSEIIALRVELKVLADIGLVYDDHHAFAERFLGQTHAAFHAELDKDHRERLGAPLPEGFGARLVDMIWAEMSEYTEAVPGVHATVAGLTVPVAVASSSGLEHIKHKLRRAGLFEAFDPHIYSGELVARGKPFPDIYLHAAAQLGIDPKVCVAVEDSINGVKSAVAAGMTAIGFVGGGHCSPRLGGKLSEAGAAQVASDMPDLARILGEMS
ncbi:MAG: HAD family hydrolase [Rhodospirillaceae bacterium]|nr:HAD family hydrolase [Rhodospirillaceae bacterium]